jgi:hypothetical protein
MSGKKEMNLSPLTIEQIADKINSHRGTLNYPYSNIEFRISIDGDELWLDFDTNSNKESPERLEKIKMIFNAIDVMWMDREFDGYEDVTVNTEEKDDGTIIQTTTFNPKKERFWYSIMLIGEGK